MSTANAKSQSLETELHVAEHMILFIRMGREWCVVAGCVLQWTPLCFIFAMQGMVNKSVNFQFHQILSAGATRAEHWHRVMAQIQITTNRQDDGMSYWSPTLKTISAIVTELLSNANTIVDSKLA